MHAAFLRDLDARLAAAPFDPDDLLQRLCAELGCAVATLHLLGDDGRLHLRAQRGLPPAMLDTVAVIPIGKGMAGIAAERRQPVQVCNLQTDASGVVRPGARLTQMAGSIAVPMLHGERLGGVLGVAKPVAYEFTADEQAFLLQVGGRLLATGTA